MNNTALNLLLRHVAKAATAALFASLVFLVSCKEDPAPEPTQQEKVTLLLTAARWPLTSVTVEGEDAAKLFVDFAITFTEKGYTTTGTTPVWARSGTWSFTNEEATLFKREDDVEVTIESIDEQNLKLTLFWDHETTDGGRTKSLKGKHEFTLKK